MMASSGFYFEEENSCGAVVAAQAMCAIFWKVTAGQLRDVGHTHTHTRWIWFQRRMPARQLAVFSS